jgi:hypothetical protein
VSSATPLNRHTFIEYKPCDLSANISKVLYCECHVTESKYVIGRGCDWNDISVVEVTGLVRLPVDGFHISLNDYKSSNVATKKRFPQNRD